jgi:hypothetical protein
MTNRRALLALAAALAAGSLGATALPEPAQAQGAAKPKPKPKPKQIFPYWENYLKIPAAERTRFAPGYFLTWKGPKPAAELPMFAVDGARRVPIAVGPDGRMTPPPVEFFRSKTALMDAPGAEGHSFNVSLELLATMAPAREVAASEVTATLNQSNAGIRKAAGLIGIAAPKMGRMIFVGAGSGEAVDASGRRTPLPIVRGAPYFQPSAMPTAQRVVLARAPSKMMLSPSPKDKG